MFDCNGTREGIGHGVLKPISLDILESQLNYRARDYENYNARINQELQEEQPLYYRTLCDLAEAYAGELYEIDSPHYKYWIERMMFLMCFQYKCISASIEARFLSEDIRL